MELFLQFACVVTILCFAIAGAFWMASQIIQVWNDWINSPTSANIEQSDAELYFAPVEHHEYW